MKAEAKVQHRPKPRYGVLPGTKTETIECEFNSTSDIRDAIYEQWYAERLKSAKKKKKEEDKKKAEELEKKKKVIVTLLLWRALFHVYGMGILGIHGRIRKILPIFNKGENEMEDECNEISLFHFCR